MGLDLPPGSRAWLLALCEAELRWAAHDWRQGHPETGSTPTWGTPIDEASRLPHEAAAATVLNLNGKRAAVMVALEAVDTDGSVAWAAARRRELDRLDTLIEQSAARYHALRAIVDWPVADCATTPAHAA